MVVAQECEPTTARHLARKSGGPQPRCLSFPKIIPARSDDAIRTELVSQRWFLILGQLAAAAHPSAMPSACASDCNMTNTKPGSAVDATRQRLEHDPGTRAGAFRSGAQHMHSARATSVRSGGRVSPSSEVDA